MRLQFLLACALAAVSAGAAPKIAPESVRLTEDANRLVTIDYTLENEPAVVTFDIEAKDEAGGWTSIGVPLVHSVGDCWRKIEPGARRILWSARRDWPNRFTAEPTLRAVVTAWATNNPPTYMVLDLATFTQTFYPSTNYFPHGLADFAYRSSKLVMRRIPAAGATFMMGQATNTATDVSCRNCFAPVNVPNRLVSLTNDFYMAIYETTQRQCGLLLGTGQNYSGQEYAHDKPVNAMAYLSLRGQPEEGIDWPATGEAVSDASVLGRMRQLSGIQFDIPTEAEWEFAARAGTETAFYNGEEYRNSEVGSEHLTELAWYKENRPPDDQIQRAGSAYFGGLHPVGQKRPNPWGLYDLYGNASEWCKDWAGDYDVAHQPVVAPPGPTTGTKRIKRGGNWYEQGVWCSSSARSSTKGLGWSLDPSGGSGDNGTYYCWSNGFRLICPAVAK